MKHSLSWEANSHSSSQEITHLLCNPKIQYRVHKISPLVPILSQMNSIHTFPPYFSKIILIWLSCVHMSSMLPLPFRFSGQNFVFSSYLSFTFYIPPISPSFI